MWFSNEMFVIAASLNTGRLGPVGKLVESLLCVSMFLTGFYLMAVAVWRAGRIRAGTTLGARVASGASGLYLN
jgi:hypothetical protein